MAPISLDNVVMYQYPKPKNPSRLPAIPHGTSSFSSHVIPSVIRPPPNHPCSSPVQPTALIPLDEENPSSIPDIDVTTVQIHAESGDFYQPAGVAPVDFDTNKRDMCNIAIDQDESKDTEKECCSNYIDGRNDAAEFPNVQGISTSGVSAQVRPPEIDSFSHCSEDVVHGSTVSDIPIWEISPDVANEFVVPTEPPGLSCVDQPSTSSAVTMPKSEACLNNSTFTALEDKDSQPIVHQPSSSNDIAATDFTAPQSERTDSSPRPRSKRRNKVQRRQSTIAGITSKPLAVIVPHRNLRPSNTPRTRRRSRRSPSTESTASDDSDDSDYVESDHAIDQIPNPVQKARPAKRQKRAATGIESSFPRQEKPQGRAHSTGSLPSQSSPESMAQKSTGPEKIKIDGHLLRKVSLGRVEYCCWFTEDHGPTVFSPSLSDSLASFQKKTSKQGQLSNMTDLQVIKIEGFFTRELNPCGDIWCCSFKERHVVPESEKSLHQEQPPLGADGLVEENEIYSIPVSSKGDQYSREEDELIVQLKEVEKLPWSRIAERFPGRSRSTLQVRYCTTLKDKRLKSHLKNRKRKIGQSKVAAEKPQALVQSPSSSRRYSLRQSRHLPDRYIAK